MRKLLKTSLMGAAAAVALAVVSMPAHAAPLLFTWNPDAVAGVTNGAAFTANNFNTADFTYSTIQTNGSFTESGVLEVTNFLLGTNGSVSTPGLLQGGAGSGQGYGLYIPFTASGMLTGWNPANPLGGYFGTLSSFNFGFTIDPTNNDVISDSGTAFSLSNPGNADVTLANGSEVAGINQVTLLTGIPGADATANFIPTGTDSGFFVTPAAQAYLALVIESSFTNNSQVSSITPNGDGTVTVKIDGGGGNSTFAVPEPGTLSLLGAAIMGLGIVKRRRRKA